MLEELYEKFEIVNSVGEHIGKIKEVYLDLDIWEIKAFKISPSALKKSYLIELKEIQKVDLEDKKLIVGDEVEKKEVPEKPTKKLYPYDELMKLHIVDKEGEKVGKITSLEIPYEKLKKFKVWKILIKTGLKERRLRVSTSEVDKVMEKIHLKKNLIDYQSNE